MGAADLPNPDEKTVNAGKLTNYLYCHVLIGMKTQQLEEEELSICYIHSYTEYNQQ